MSTITNHLSLLSRLFALMILSLVITSCGDDDDDDDNDDDMEPAGLTADDGFFIVNEGGFGNSNTTLSFYSNSSQEVINSVFQQANGRPLGDQSQSMAIHNEEGFIVVQNSGKVEVIDINTAESIATITDGLESPRYFIGLNEEKGYVSDWGLDGTLGTVRVIDLDTYFVTATITTGSGSNQMVIRDGMLYVANAGGFGVDNSVTIINTATDEVVEDIPTGDNPSNLVLDGSNLWVLGRGNLAFDAEFNLVVEESTPGFISLINSNNTIEATLELSEITFGTADDLVLDESDNALFFNYNGNVWRISTDLPETLGEPFIEQNLYGLALDPTTGNLIGTEAPDFTSGGNLIFYDGDGNELSSTLVGIGPNSAVFK